MVVRPPRPNAAPNAVPSAFVPPPPVTGRNADRTGRPGGPVGPSRPVGHRRRAGPGRPGGPAAVTGSIDWSVVSSSPRSPQPAAPSGGGRLSALQRTAVADLLRIAPVADELGTAHGDMPLARGSAEFAEGEQEQQHGGDGPEKDDPDHDGPSMNAGSST